MAVGAGAIVDAGTGTTMGCWNRCCSGMQLQEYVQRKESGNGRRFLINHVVS